MNLFMFLNRVCLAKKKQNQHEIVISTFGSKLMHLNYNLIATFRHVLYNDADRCDLS